MSGQVQSRPRTPSVAELQAALLAAQRGDFAGTGTSTATPSRLGAPVPAREQHALRRRQRGPGAATPASPTPATEPARQLILLGSHGGSGARCLTTVLPGAELADKTYSCQPGPPVVLVCRANHRGLTSAQDHAREHRDGDCGASQPLLGLVVVAAAPGRVPSSMRRLEQLVDGAVPILGHVPWVEDWQLGPARPFQRQPVWLTALVTSIAAALPAGKT